VTQRGGGDRRLRRGCGQLAAMDFRRERRHRYSTPRQFRNDVA
jgi:hypothetical protein